MCCNLAVKEYGKANIKPPKSFSGGTPIAWGTAKPSNPNLTPFKTWANAVNAAARAVLIKIDWKIWFNCLTTLFLVLTTLFNSEGGGQVFLFFWDIFEIPNAISNSIAKGNNLDFIVSTNLLIVNLLP